MSLYPKSLTKPCGRTRDDASPQKAFSEIQSGHTNPRDAPECIYIYILELCMQGVLRLNPPPRNFLKYCKFKKKISGALPQYHQNEIQDQKHTVNCYFICNDL